ncbi:MAG: DUF4062 domain-containing protein [Pseudomonadota bacterium]
MSTNKPRVMLSSTFLDLESHRKIAASAIRQHGMEVIEMESHPLSTNKDVIGSSFAMVEEADAYFCLLGKRYGAIYEDARNPNRLSTTALEFEKAKEKELPFAGLLFGPAYPVSDDQNEFDSEKRAKLDELRSALHAHRVVYAMSKEDEFEGKANLAAHKLKEEIEENKAITQSAASVEIVTRAQREDTLPPAPPAIHFVPPFAQGMPFTGRARELDEITVWARSNDPMLIVEAIGGMGKSMLTHHWATEHALNILPDLAGRFWYSFYEDGASMRDFCVHALSYIEHAPVSEFAEMNRADLRDRLVRRLKAKPYLMVLDGLERVLVAYNRYDAAQVRDEDAEKAPEGDERDPNICIRPDDDELLRLLAEAGPSKLLVSTRNMPTALRISATGGGPRAGVSHAHLTGLASDDAEHLMRLAGVTGDGTKIRAYLDRNFGGHPLMVGVVAGLVTDHAPAPGDFDHWLNDPLGAKALDLSSIEGLVGKREHVLKVAFEGLDDDTRKLLARLSFFSSAVAYAALVVLNPTLPDRPEKVENPEETFVPSSRRKEAKEAYAAYLKALERWEHSPERQAAERWLREALKKLHRRGLLIREGASYDLHPLVRGFTRASLSPADRDETGGEVADYARQQAPRSVSRESSGEELRAYFEIVRALLLGDRMAEAAELLATPIDTAVQSSGLSRAQFELIMQLFSPTLKAIKSEVANFNIPILSNQAALAASELGRFSQANALHLLDLKSELDLERRVASLRTTISNLAITQRALGRLAAETRLLELASAVGVVLTTGANAATAYALCLANYHRGNLDWQTYAPAASLNEPDAFQGPTYMIPWLRYIKVTFDKRSGTLKEANIDAVLARKNIKTDLLSQHLLYKEKAFFLQDRGDDDAARQAFEKAIQLGRQIDRPTYDTEALYVVTLARLGDPQTARDYAERLSQLREPPHLELAKLWLELGETEKARKQVLLAYPKAWADGPPNAFHWELQDCRAILKTLGEPEPQLPTVRPEDLPPFEFEAEILAKIEEEKEKQRKAEEEDEADDGN